jgi:hypothetical protein
VRKHLKRKLVNFMRDEAANMGYRTGSSVSDRCWNITGPKRSDDRFCAQIRDLKNSKPFSA